MCDWKNYPLDEREDRLVRFLGLSLRDKPQDVCDCEERCWLDPEIEDLRTRIHADRWTRPLLH